MAACVHPWKQCIVCSGDVQFSSSKEFISHLRQVHCRREGGSYVCHYGYNGVCNSLPLEGVNDADYERHVLNHHVRTLTAARRQEPQRRHSQSLHRRTGSSGEVSTLQTLAHTPNVVADGLKWSLHNASQNLPALLNDPSRGRQRDLFTKTWGEGFVDKPVVASSLLPDVSLSSFGDYVRGISKRYRKQLRRGNSAHLSGHRSVEDDPAVDGGSELASIPRLWFDPDFDLRRRQTFQLICPPPRSPPHSSSPSYESARRRSSSGRLKRTPSPRSAASPVPTSTEPSILEQLTHYMDLVEIRIARQIAEKSESFFDAMSSHDVLMDQVTQASRSVQTLRRGMASLRQEQVVPAMRVLRGRLQRRNGTGLLQKLRLMSTVQQTPATIQLVLASCDYVGALDVIATSQEVLQQELAGVQAFRHLGTELSEMRKAIDVMVSADYVRLIAADLNRPLDQSPAIEQEQLLAIVFGMIRLHNFSLVDTYRDEAYTAVRAVLKQVSIEALSEADTPDDVTAAGGCDGGTSDGGSGNQPLSHLSPTQWVALLQRACRDLAKLLSRIKTVSDMIAEVVDAAAGRSADLPLPSSATGDNLIRPASSLEDRNGSPTLPVSISDTAEEVMISGELHARIKSSLSSLISSVCDYVHERCAKLLQTCMQDSVLDVQQFLSLADVIRHFVADCEKLCGRRSTALHLAFQSRASQFVGRFHGERRAKLQLLLESERWRQADVPAEFQRLADHVQNTGEACLPPSPLRTSADGVRTGGAVGCGRQLVVGQSRYAVVGTALLLLRILLEYCDSARHLPAVAAELLNRLVELLQLYNSRCCQLVVGAGAIQLVGLKTISIRNLALSARCLQLIQHFIPLIRKLYKELVGDRGDTALRQLNADYDAHIAEIDGKLVNIVCDICDNQLNRWQAKPPVPSQSFRSVCRAVSKLHEATSDVLERDHRTALMRCVCSRLLHSLRRHVTQRLKIKADGGPRHGVVTSEVMFYQQHLTSSCDFTPAESILQSLWSTNSSTNNNSEPAV